MELGQRTLTHIFFFFLGPPVTFVVLCIPSPLSQLMRQQQSERSILFATTPVNPFAAAAFRLFL
jgi:hypothetical protein